MQFSFQLVGTQNPSPIHQLRVIHSLRIHTQVVQHVTQDTIVLQEAMYKLHVLPELLELIITEEMLVIVESAQLVHIVQAQVLHHL